jgi:hypothetical protein
MRRAGFLATLVAGVLFLGASVHGMTKVDTTLKIAAAPTPQPELVRDDACERPHEKRHPRV